MEETVKKILSIIVLVLLIIAMDIWIIMPLIESYNILNQTDVMMGNAQADLRIVGDMFKNPLLSIKALGENLSTWFFVSIIMDGAIAGLFYMAINKDSYSHQSNGKVINYSKTNGTYGTAQWMTLNELQSKEMKEMVSIKGNDGIMFGKSLDNEKLLVTLHKKTRLNKNIAVYGAPGTGKSRCFVRPTAINLADLGESMVFTDPKGELFRSLAPYLESKGYEVKALNLVNMVYSDRWNPLGNVKDDISAQTFAQVIIDNTSGSDTPEKSDFWTRTETNLLKALALYVTMEMPEKDANMKTLYSLVAARDVKKTENIFKTLKDTHPALQPYNVYCQASETVRTSAVIGLGTRLQVFQSKIVQDLTAESDINLAMAGVKKCAYFCITSDMQSTFDFLSGLFFSFLFIDLINLADNRRSGRCKVPVNFILDEFPNIARIADFPKKISTARSRGINCFVIFQSIPQLQNRYKNMEWAEIIGSCDSNLFLGCNDPITADYISKVLGTATVEDKSISKEQGFDGLFDFGKKTDRVGKRNLQDLNEVLSFDNRNAILMLRGKNPLILKKYDYSEHPKAKKLVEKSVKEYKKEWSTEFREIEEAALKEELRKLGIEYDNNVDIDNETDVRIIEGKTKAESSIYRIPGEDKGIEKEDSEEQVNECASDINKDILEDVIRDKDIIEDSENKDGIKYRKKPKKTRKKSDTVINGQISVMEITEAIINNEKEERESNLISTNVQEDKVQPSLLDIVNSIENGISIGANNNDEMAKDISIQIDEEINIEDQNDNDGLFD